MSNGVPQAVEVYGSATQMPRTIEVGFPIVENNRRAEPERNSQLR
jgi:hypothetical protein